ncbi:hypothetical protein QBC47DRAFT_443359 [Echria macrotheca]|uniref:Uncharacterized protein n=1 Tax=Echria macrotheca TaxID=438768 RepID=A0AAJ0BJ12_9PEZI|nr:hypothetical protein QBC47DRAFT_443359 [Echria macrotheca]
MAGDLVSWIRGDHHHATKKSTNPDNNNKLATAQKAAPIMKTIQAVQSLGQAGQEVLESLNRTATCVEDITSHLTKNPDLIKTHLPRLAEQFIPSIQIMARSFGDSVRLATQFSLNASAVGIASNLVITYQGVRALHLIAAKLDDISTALAAQTALTAHREFPGYVHDMVRERVGQTALDSGVEHWFFVYHPDDDWYPGFYHLLEKKPIGPAFCGYTNQIDTVFVFMLAARRYLEGRKKGGNKKPVRFHLLIPAYQPILIAEALSIPEEIGDFVIEARINSNKEFVWLNLPEEQRRRYVSGVGQWDPTPANWWEAVLSKVGLAGRRPVLGERRVLGTRQGGGDEEDEEGDGDKGGGQVVRVVERDGNEETRNRKTATPLHHRRRRQDRDKRRSVEAEDREGRSVVRSRGKRSSSVG